MNEKRIRQRRKDSWETWCMEAAKFEGDIEDKRAIVDIVTLEIKGQIFLLGEDIARLNFKLQA